MARNTSDVPDYVKFMSGSLAGVFSTVICYPAEFVKTRMQLPTAGKDNRPLTTAQMSKMIYQQEGIPGFYRGLNTSMVRHILFSGGRVGIFQILMDRFSEKETTPSLQVRLGASSFAGLVAAVISLPHDVVMIRMMCEGSVPPERRRNYKGMNDALIRITREEGARALFLGMVPVVVRTVPTNASQLITYTYTKDLLIKYKIYGDDLPCHLASSLLASLVTTVVILPADIAKTRLQNMRKIDGVPEYSGIMDSWNKIIKNEGFLALWKGFTPMLLRTVPQVTALLIFYEALISYYKELTHPN